MSTEKINQSQKKDSIVITDTATTAFEKISMDIVGPLPEAKSGNLYKGCLKSPRTVGYFRR